MSKKCSKVLIVEDDADIRECMLDVLEHEGFETAEARHGLEALELLKKEKKPVLVFLDLMMPKMSGWELLDHKQELSGHRVVTMSVFAPTASLQDPTPLDVDATLRKPVSIEEVLALAHRFAVPAQVATAG